MFIKFFAKMVVLASLLIPSLASAQQFNVKFQGDDVAAAWYVAGAEAGAKCAQKAQELFPSSGGKQIRYFERCVQRRADELTAPPRETLQKAPNFSVKKDEKLDI